jgi:hypothetical protein
MKLFLDRKKREFVKSTTSNVALEYLVLKRRDLVPLEFIFVENGAAVTLPTGTEIKCALKLAFTDANFLALATGASPTLDLNTVPLEAAFSTGAASLQALIEVRWLVPGETLRTATLKAEVQNSVILGTEGTPQAMPDGKASQAEAEAGTDNTKWMTPLRTAQAIAELAPPPTWQSITGKPTEFPPEVHTHDATEITGLSSFIVASAPSLSINATVRIGDGVSVTFPIDGLVSSDPEHVLVALNGVTQTPGTDYLVSEATGTITFDAAPAAGMQISCTALGLRTVQPPLDPTLYLFAFDQSTDGLTTYSGRLLNADRPAAPALPETATTWTIRRSTLSAAGRVLATAEAVGSWANRETLVYA